MKHWKFWDWAAYGALATASFMMAFDSALRNAPEFAKLLPGLAGSTIWAFAPAALVMFATVVLIYRWVQEQPSPKSEDRKSLIAPRTFPRIGHQPTSDFALLPRHFVIDLLAQIPTVEVGFFVVSYLPTSIRLTVLDLTLRISGAPPLEDIPLRQKDWQVDPKEYEVIFCRRQLTNAERESFPWKPGRVTSASFQLSAKATDGEKSFSYGPVSGMVIEGWIIGPRQEKSI